jgi:hypothetical protein
MAKKKKVSTDMSEDKKDMMAEIKKMEAEKREQAMKAQTKTAKEDKTVSFDSWWMKRSKQIPAMHRKEIVKADFKGRKLSDRELESDYDKALKAYGVELK